MIARSCLSLIHDFPFTFSMLDLVNRGNHSIVTGVLIECNDYTLYKVAESLLELNDGSTSYIVGLFLGHTASKI